MHVHGCSVVYLEDFYVSFCLWLDVIVDGLVSSFRITIVSLWNDRYTITLSCPFLYVLHAVYYMCVLYM